MSNDTIIKERKTMMGIPMCVQVPCMIIIRTLSKWELQVLGKEVPITAAVFPLRAVTVIC